ncbi:hypothetical protein JD844_026822 [Phrynosoma platyrhinos]|uniref:Transmembrane protein 154 n=1 Tax=Phrynosoma platyrhinos TaxID=52577 RepID=A0ABQ7SFD2_PHRPL|nr:hypothetical protein JD844_026822 [Phrynosoma platyrhinos]
MFPSIPNLAGSADAMEGEEASGDNPALSTIMVITDTTTSAVFLTTNDQDLQAATMVTKTENSEMGSTSTTDITDLEPESLHPALMFGVPAALLLVLLILLVIFIVRRHKQKQSKQDELGSENCKSPIFEEDTPSVMEIEMEELDKWMNSLKRNGLFTVSNLFLAESEYLPPVKEEKDCNANPSGRGVVTEKKESQESPSSLSSSITLTSMAILETFVKELIALPQFVGPRYRMQLHKTMVYDAETKKDP